MVPAVGVPPDGALDCRMELIWAAVALRVASSLAVGMSTRTVPGPHSLVAAGKVTIPKRATLPELVKNGPMVDLIARSRVSQVTGQSSANCPQVRVPPSGC